MRSDKSFKEFFGRGKGVSGIIPLLIIGAVLLLCGFLFSENKTEEKSEDALSSLCSEIEGVGECRVTLTYGEDGEVYGVAVLCEGADNSAVRADIIDLFTSIYGIGANRITVLKIRDKN